MRHFVYAISWDIDRKALHLANAALRAVLLPAVLELEYLHKIATSAGIADLSSSEEVCGPVRCIPNLFSSQHVPLQSAQQ